MKSSILRDKIKKIIEHRHFQKYEKYITLLLWLVAIFYLSNKSLGFLSEFDVWSFILRKLAHMFEFGMLCFLFFRILKSIEKRHIYWDLFWAVVFSILYACSDEYHQLMIPGRIGTYRDVLIDTAGILISAWLIFLYYHKEYKIKKFSWKLIKHIISG